METINVIKHDGSTEPLQLDKATKSLEWAIGDLKNVSLSDIEMQSKLHFYDGIKTSYILDVFIKTTYDMSSLRYHNYDTVSRNLKLQKLYKQVFNGIVPISISEFIEDKEDIYSPHIYNFSAEDIELFEQQIDHSRDFNFTASGLDAVVNSYGLKGPDGNPSETPQLIYMLIAMDAFHDNPQRVLDLYEALSTFKVTLPTPEMKAFRTHSSDYASCCTIRMGDSIVSWTESSKALIKHTVASAGVGISVSDIASVGDLVKNGTITHSGKIPILRGIDADIRKSSQNGRRGSATAFVAFFDTEIEDILALKSPRTALDKRINDLSYGICLHQLVYDRARNGKHITLLSTRQVPELKEAMTKPDFVLIYEAAERAFPDAPKIDAQDFMKSLATERFENSAYYIVNIDEINSNTPYTEPIVQSNICVEFCTPTKELSEDKPHDPAIGICVLANINQGLVPIPDLPFYTKLLVELQSRAALRQDHPTTQANAFVEGYRDIGIGFSNHAYWLAKNGWRYGQQEAINAHDDWMENLSYGLIKASNELAKEHGPAPLFHLTNWKEVLPFQRANKKALALADRKRTMQHKWDELHDSIKEYGLFNCGLSMIPPAESSSIPSNQTSAMEPIKELLTIKDKQGFNHKQYAPDPLALADKYDYAYDRDINKDYLKHVAVTQIWTDKSISANTFYSPKRYENEKVNITDIISDIYFFKSLGGKTIYYQNTEVPEDVQQQTGGCQDGGCSV